MADHMAGEIHIGGKVRRKTVQALCKAINGSGASLEWGGGVCHFATPEDLLSARAGEDGEPQVLKLFDDQARWGEFAELEKFLQEQGIAFCRWSEGKYEYSPEVFTYRPGTELQCWETDHERQPVVPVSTLRPIEAKLTHLLKPLKQGKARNVLAQIEGVRNALRAELPPDVPALETLEIVED